MKTEFDLMAYHPSAGTIQSGFVIKIIGQEPKNRPYINIDFGAHQVYHLKDSDLERLAVNILKALKSDKLK